jgi:hypothetical protein
VDNGCPWWWHEREDNCLGSGWLFAAVTHNCYSCHRRVVVVPAVVASEFEYGGGSLT